MYLYTFAPKNYINLELELNHVYVNFLSSLKEYSTIESVFLRLYSLDSRLIIQQEIRQNLEWCHIKKGYGFFFVSKREFNKRAAMFRQLYCAEVQKLIT